MVGRRIRWAAATLGLSTLGACDVGLTLNAIVLLITAGIFVGTILLQRTP
jgi:hypothetical protein